MKGLSFRRKHSRSQGSLDFSSSLIALEARLTEKTDLIDEMKKVVPLDVQAPGIITLGAKGAGKSTILEALTGVPLSRGVATRRPIRLRIVSDPTCTKEFALVSGTDKTFREDTKRIENVDELPKLIGQLSNNATTLPTSSRGVIDPEEAAEENSSAVEVDDSIFVRVTRPSGPTYTVIDLPALPDAADGTEMARFLRYLKEDSDRLILAVLPVDDVFERANAIHIAKMVDPESKRTIGVVTKMNLVEKDMGIVEKLQMTSNKHVVLPLGYVAVRASLPNDQAINWEKVLEAEREFFTTNPLLKGLRPERWGIPSLKALLINFQANSITQRIPEMSQKVRTEIEGLEKNPKHGMMSVFDSTNTSEFFTKLCAEATSVAFDINELANASITRQDRRLNLGPRFLVAIEAREVEARRCLPSCLSSQYGSWLTKEMEEFRGVIANNDSMMHPIFRKAIREICFPVLRKYAADVMEDADSILREVTGLLIDERFGDYPRLVESLKRDVAVIQAQKRGEAEGLIVRLLEAELNWVFVSDHDLLKIQKDVEIGINGSPAPKADADLWSLDDIPDAPTTLTTSKCKSKIDAPEEDVVNKDLKAMQLALDAYVRLVLRRIFYSIPMNSRNIIMNEFRKDLVSLVAEKYNDEGKLRTLMSEELWVGHSRQQREGRRDALMEVLHKLDHLS